MKPVMQTLDGLEEGNCLQACIASLFEMGLEEVPHFVLRDDWVGALDGWLGQFDLQSVLVDLERGEGEDMWEPYGYHLICGKGPRADCQHAVVGYNGRVVHDPHPDGGGLEIEESWTLFVKRFESGADDLRQEVL